MILVGVIPAMVVYYSLSTKQAVDNSRLSTSLEEINNKLIQIDSLKDSVSALSTASATTPTTTPIPKAIVSPTKKWEFNKSTYEVKTSNVSYGKENFYGYKIEFDIYLRNISINPFVLGYSITECTVTKNGKNTQFRSGSSKSFDKALPVGENRQDRVKMSINGYDYDESGNKTGPYDDLRIKSCSFYPLTKPQQPQQLSASGTQPPPTEKSVEPTTIFF